MKRITLFDVLLTSIFIIFIIFFIKFEIEQKKEGESFLYIQTGKSEFYYSLDQKKTIEVQGEHGLTKIKIDNGKFSFIESACPNKDCIKAGAVSFVNFPVICLPNKVSAYIVNEKKENEFDGIAR